MHTGSTRPRRTVARAQSISRPYTSAELDQLTEQLEAIERGERCSSSCNVPQLSQWAQLALQFAELSLVVDAIGERICGSIASASRGRPSRAQVRVLRRLATTDGQLDPTDDDDALWCDPNTMRALRVRRWVEWDGAVWRVTPYGLQALARHDARCRVATRVQLQLLAGGRSDGK